MYATTNFKTKKALKEAVKLGQTVTVFQPNSLGPSCDPPQAGKVYLEGPHYPAPHSWYAEAWLESGKVVRVR